MPPKSFATRENRGFDYDRVKDIKFAEVDVDSFELPELFDEMGIRSIPTLVLYHNGDVITKSTGIKGERELYELFKTFDDNSKSENEKNVVH